jgi:hypothetical protein
LKHRDFLKHRDTESTERKTRGRKTRGRRTRGGSEKQEEEHGAKSKKKRTEWEARRGQGEKRDMLAMLDAGLYF